MKSTLLKLAALMLMVAVVFVSCEKEKHVKSVSVSSTQLILYMNKTATITATVHPIDATNKAVIWTSSNNNVATVDNGKVTAIKQGTAIITITTKEGKHMATCTVEVLHPIEPELVFVDGGTFIMGCIDCSNESDYDECDIPIHQKVTVSSFKIAKFLLTVNQYGVIMHGDTTIPPYGNMPFRRAFGEWNEIQEVIQKLNEITGKNYRLPTYAEWEYAARGGNKSKKYRYSGSNDIDEVAWYRGNFDVQQLPYWPSVGLKKANELGVYDMSGLVWEVCSDWCEAVHWGTVHVICGGSIFRIESECTVSSAFCGFGSAKPDIAGIAIRLVLP